MLRIEGPELISWDLSSSLKLRGHGNSLREGDCVLIAVRLETGLVLSGRAIFDGPSSLLDVRDCLNIPWKDGHFLITLLRRDHMSNRIHVRLAKSEFTFHDPEVEKFIATHRRHGNPLPIWPPPGEAGSGSKQNLPYYKRLAESPEVPEQAGIVVKIRKTVIYGSFRLHVTEDDIVSATDRKANRFAYLPVTAVVPIALVITGGESTTPAQFDLRIPSYGEVDRTSQSCSANGFFALDLQCMEDLPKAGTRFLYAFSGQTVTGPIHL